jgi:hypothetical protein
MSWFAAVEAPLTHHSTAQRRHGFWANPNPRDRRRFKQYERG